MKGILLVQAIIFVLSGKEADPGNGKQNTCFLRK